ncbi:MAG: helix-turn-helix domain-containing protein [Propionibacteriaceae bacterium]|jgi:excisionase family DNA binding protein|nr:helix-turn-helix domain-containing protein [Propionibacteriaceae bacterium]
MPAAAPRAYDKTYLPSPTDIAQAQELFSQLEEDLAQTGKTVLMSASGQTLELPPTLFEVLRFVGATLASGNGVTVVPRAVKLTTQEAADFLGVSRPTFVKLLEQGAIPFEKVGRHRRVTLDDLLNYQEREQARRRTVLTQAARNNQISGMLALTVMPDPYGI